MLEDLYVKTVEGLFMNQILFVATEHSISKLTIINVLNELKEYNSTFSSAAKHNNISSTQAEAIFDDYVNIPRQTLPRVICIDEIYSKTSRKNKYSCLLLDFETSNREFNTCS